MCFIGSSPFVYLPGSMVVLNHLSPERGLPAVPGEVGRLRAARPR